MDLEAITRPQHLRTAEHFLSRLKEVSAATPSVNIHAINYTADVVYRYPQLADRIESGEISPFLLTGKDTPSLLRRVAQREEERSAYSTTVEVDISGLYRGEIVTAWHKVNTLAASLQAIAREQYVKLSDVPHIGTSIEQDPFSGLPVVRRGSIKQFEFTSPSA